MTRFSSRRARPARPLLTAIVLGLALVVALAACSGDDSANDDADATGDDGGGDKPTTTVATTRTTVARPDGPAADLATEITGANAPFVASAEPEPLDALGYVEHEYVASGVAASYRAEGDLAEDGAWTFVPDGEAPYRTRALVRRPAEADRFSGTVVVEWLNVSGGLDASPDWTSLREEIARKGHIWVGVSAQRIGVMGGPVLVTVEGVTDDAGAGDGLRAIDPERYGSLEHPGDGFAFDIFTQIARALRAGGAATGGVTPDVVLAAGESQSAIAMVTYVNGVQPLTRAFDGFFVHSRGATGLPLVESGEHADLAGAIGGSVARLRTDGDEPVLVLQSEGDVTGVLNSVAARQPDTDRVRLWEVAGTAHADRHLVGPVADLVDCGAPINDGPLHVVAKAAFRALETWVRTGAVPPEAPRLEIAGGDAPAIARDADGIALGGIRTPPVDVPVQVLSGDPGPAPSTICILLGSTHPLPGERLAEMYASRDDYLTRYEAGADAAIEAGFVLEDDRDALMEYADPDLLAG